MMMIEFLLRAETHATHSRDFTHWNMPPIGNLWTAGLYETGLEEKLQNKLVFGESISQTNQFIISMVADIGFTSKSVVLSSLMKGIGAWKEIDKKLYKPIAQGIVVINNRNTFQKEAMQFKDFLLSAKGKEILYKFGYQVSTK